MSFELYVDSLFTSPYALSVFVALTEKRLPFTIKTVDLAPAINIRAPTRTAR
jgi:glutathione S-transferase